MTANKKCKSINKNLLFCLGDQREGHTKILEAFLRPVGICTIGLSLMWCFNVQDRFVHVFSRFQGDENQLNNLQDIVNVFVPIKQSSKNEEFKKCVSTLYITA